jgi:hypothetical protein
MKQRAIWLSSASALAVLLLGGLLVAQNPATPPKAAPAAAPAQKPADTTPGKAQPSKEQVIAAQRPSYPLDTCPISGHKLGGDMGAPVDYVAGGRLVRLCCKDCVGELEKSPGAAFAKIDAAVIEKEKAAYPLKKCPISGEELGKMGEPLNYVYGTRLVRMCCKSCTKDFLKDPDKYVGEINTAYITAQKASYKPTTCPVSGEKLGGTAVDQLYGTQLVRLCCKDCVPEFQKTPDKFLAKLSAPPAK